MKRFTDTMVLAGSSACAARASSPTIDAAVGQVAHDRRQQRAALPVGDDLRRAAAHGADERVRGAEVDADREPVLVRVRGLSRLGNLEQRHG